MSIIVKGMKMPENCMNCPFSCVGADWYYCYCPGVDGKAYGFEQAETLPDDCPLDEIVRCKECKYYHDSDGCFFSTMDNGFCSWAERRTDEYRIKD